MTGWHETRLGDVCRSIDDGDWIETKDQGGNDFRLLQVSNVGVGAFRETGKYRYVTKETFDRLRCNEIRPGMVLVARMPDPVGRAWFVDRLKEPAITSVDVAIVDPNSTRLDGRFCAYLLNAPQQLAHAAAVAGGTTRVRITRRQLADFQILLPELSYQRKVSDLLAAFDELIENNRRRVQVLEEMARVIYREWFVHLRYPGHKDTAFVDSPLGLIPEGWQVGIVGELIFLQRGFDLPTRKRVPGSIPVVGASGIQGHHGMAKVAGPGVTTGRSGTIGSVTYVSGDFWPLNTALWVKEFRCSTPLFAYMLLESLDLKQAASGAAVPTLNRNHVHGLPVVLPPRELICEWDAVARPLFELAATLRRNVKLLVATRDFLLPSLVAGQIDVSSVDVEALVEGSVA